MINIPLSHVANNKLITKDLNELRKANEEVCKHVTEIEKFIDSKDLLSIFNLEVKF